MAKNRKKQNKHHHAVRADRSAGSIHTDTDLYKYARSVFRERSNQFQKNGDSISVVYEGLDFDTLRLKRRVEAVTAVSEEVKARFSDLCPDIPGRFSILEDWVGMNAYPYSAYDYVEKYVFSSFAAAIWILDYIRDHGKLEQLNQILASIPSESDALMPDVWDPCHSQQLLEKMVSVITNRNQEQPTSQKRNKQDHNTLLRVYMDKATAYQQIDHTKPSRVLFDQVLSLIDPDTLQSIKHRYTEGYWEWLRRYFSSRRIFVEEELRIRSQIGDFQKQLQALADQIPAISNPGRKSPLLVQSNPTPLSTPGFDTQSEHMIRRNKLDRQNRILFEKQEEFNTRFSRFTQEVGEFPLIPHDALASQYGKEIADCWSDYTIDDPYSMCMAFLALLDEGSDLPWCYFPGINFQTCYASMLPWTRTKFSDSCDGIWEHFDSEIGTVVPGPSNDPLSKKIKVPDVDEWYQLKYHSTANKGSGSQILYSLSHILYETTGCIMPRNPGRYQSALETWNRYGINTKKTNLNLLYCMSLLGEAKHRSEHTPFLSDCDRTDTENIPETTEELQKQLHAMRDELRRCKQALQDATDEIGSGRKRQRELTEKLSRRDSEIRDLNNLIFWVTDTTSELGVKFPYRTASQIIVFGYDDAWLQRMQVMIPDAAFIQRCSKGVADLVRKADVIWIQPQDMPYGDYNQIITEIRKFDATLRLFPTSDILECAALLVKADIATC